MVNGGFEACAPADVATTAYAPDAFEGAVACAGWVTRKTIADLTGFVPKSETRGVLLASGGHVGALAIEYDDADGAVVVEQRFTLDRRVTVMSDVAELRFSYRTLARFAIGAHVEVSAPGGTVLVAGQDTPFLTFADDEWHTARLLLPVEPGTGLVALALEIPDGTRDATLIQFDDVALTGVAFEPRTHG